MLRRGLVLDLSVAFGEPSLGPFCTIFIPNLAPRGPVGQHLQRTDTYRLRFGNYFWIPILVRYVSING